MQTGGLLECNSPPSIKGDGADSQAPGCAALPDARSALGAIGQRQSRMPRIKASQVIHKRRYSISPQIRARP